MYGSMGICIYIRMTTSEVYKNFNHRVNHSNFILSRDIETNPGPIDPIKTIQAPYSQDNVVLFGLNAGTQCVTSLYLPTEIMVFHPIRTVQYFIYMYTVSTSIFIVNRGTRYNFRI